MPMRNRDLVATKPATIGASTLPAGTHLFYQGGKVIQNVRVVQVLYGSGTYIPELTSTSGVNMASAYTQMVTSGLFDWLHEYDTTSPAQSIGRGSFLGSVQITPATSRNGSTIDDSAIQEELAAQINAGTLTAPTDNVIYMMHFPVGKTIRLGGELSCDPNPLHNSFCAYHSTSTIGSQNVYYGVMPDLNGGCSSGCGQGSTFQRQMSAASHELIEAVTDPEVGLTPEEQVTGPPLGWVNPPPSGPGQFAGFEIGDICNQIAVPFVGTDGNTYTVQQEFSNQINDCIAMQPGTSAGIRTVANADGRLEAFRIGAFGNVLHTWQTQPSGPWVGSWQPFDVAGVKIRSIDVGRNADGRLEAIAIAADGSVLHSWQTSASCCWIGSWQTFYTTSDQMRFLKVAQNADGRLEVFGVGTNGVTYHTWETQPSGPWVGSWAVLYSGGAQLSSFDIARNADGRLEAIGIGADGSVVHTWQTSASCCWNGSWQPFYTASDKLRFVKVAKNADGRLEVLGVSPNGFTYRTVQTQPSGPWNGSWAVLYSTGNKPFTFDIGQNADGRLEAIGIGASGNIFHTWQTQANGSWNGSWQAFNAGDHLYSIDVARNADGRLEAMTIGADGGVLHSWETQASCCWNGSWVSF
jgi:hypothetical protein